MWFKKVPRVGSEPADRGVGIEVCNIYCACLHNIILA